MKKCTYSKCILPSFVKDYFLQYMSYGYHLDKHLIKLVDLSSGRYYAYMPNDISLQEALSFEDGRCIDYSVSRRCVAKTIACMLLGSDNRVCLMVDTMGESTESYSTRFYKYLCFYDREAYFCLHTGNSNEESIHEVLIEAQQPNYFLAVVSTSSIGFRNSDRPRDISDNELRQIASNAIAIIIESYDGCGYIIYEI